jgi:hypothetical protein
MWSCQFDNVNLKRLRKSQEGILSILANVDLAKQEMSTRQKNVNGKSM